MLEQSSGIIDTVLKSQTKEEGMDQLNRRSAPTFFEQWAIYQSVITNNYMFHSEIIDLIRQQLGGSDLQLSVLDLGCGDAYVISKSLLPQRQLRYCGVDTSGRALDFARQNLAGFRGEINLILNDFLCELEQTRATFDVIVCGYTLHHLPSIDKLRLLALVRERLATDGIFILYDIETNDGETPEQYKQRSFQVMQQEWCELDASQLESVLTHVRSHDLPESSGFYAQAFRDSGFRQVERLFRDPHGLFSLYFLGSNFKVKQKHTLIDPDRSGESITLPWNGRGWEWNQVMMG